MSTGWWLALYCFLILAASMAGGWLPMLIRFSHRGMQFVMSFVSGLMLGVALFIMLPHAAEGQQSLDQSMIWMMAGLLTMFFLLRAFHFHQHGAPAELIPGPEHDHDHDHDHDHHAGPSDVTEARDLPSVVKPAVHSHCAHGHDHHGHGHDHHGGQHAWSWTGIGIGLTVHTLLDGIALAASVHVDGIGVSAIPIGLGTFLAIALHKPLDAMAITSLMTAGGWTARARQLVNLVFGLMVPIGVLLFYVGIGQASVHESLVVSRVLAFSAGLFLCISLGDLLPEIQFHTHDRIQLSVLLVLGVMAAYYTGQLDRSTHQHGHGHDHGHAGAPEHHHSDDHENEEHGHEHDHNHGHSE